MHRIIAGSLFARDPQPYAFNLRVHDLGNGHIEALAQPRYAWHEVERTAQAERDAMMAEGHIWKDGGWVPYDHAADAPKEPSKDVREAVATHDRERAARRARTRVRRLAKVKLLTDMLTLTYRLNVTDRAQVQRDLDVFLKRVRRVLPGFEYIAVLERQKRGAWHVHLGVRRFCSHYLHAGKLVKSYDLLRSMWRGVVGADNGNVDVSRGRAVRRSVAKLAAYLAKYIGKSFEDAAPKYANSYSASGRALPDAVLERCSSPLLADAISDLVKLIDPEASKGEWSQVLLSSGGYYLCISPPPDRGKKAA